MAGFLDDGRFLNEASHSETRSPIPTRMCNIKKSLISL